MASRRRSTTVRTGVGERGLAHYRSKRDFDRTPEPRGEVKDGGQALSFVIQKHAASHLHYDFRLELDGVLMSWAVPKGPSLDPADKRLAVQVEDHPLSYGSFEGTIPKGQYGAGTVVVWDRGTWTPVGDARTGLAKGKLAFILNGQKLTGRWELVRIAKGQERQQPWLLFKKRDGFARPRSKYDVLEELPGALAAPFPRKLSPQLATLTERVPEDGEWSYEIKFDGYRILTRIHQGKVTLLTRGGHDWTDRMPQLARELGQLGLDSAWLDGEVIVPGADDSPDFNALQKALDQHNGAADILYFLFDLPFHQGFDLRPVELAARRQFLKGIVAKRGTEHVLFSEDFGTDATAVLGAACSMKLEGVIAKRRDAPYASGRSTTWLKLKCKQRQEFVVCGFVDRSDDPRRIGSLLLGVYDSGGELVSVGRVGTGWDSAESARLHTRLKMIETATPPWKQPARKRGRWSRASGDEHWVRPRLVVEVEFAQWTPDGQIRHASYVALRSDMPPKDIVREVSKSPPKSAPAATVTHGERVIDPASRLTKQDLADYYAAIAPAMLPHLKGRPCSLVRAPAGVTEKMFFQKHARPAIPGIRELPASLWPAHAPLVEIHDAQALLGAAQMNVIEFHTWNSRTKNIGMADRMVFDLDPGAGTAWEQVQQAATLTRSLLQELGLESWLKTSGGKGLHVVVPLMARWNAETVKGLAKAVVQHMAKTIPERFVARSGPANRVGRIFVDYLRNGMDATTVAAFSARARPGLGVSMPVAWEDLSRLRSGAHWTIADAANHVATRKQDPWQPFWRKRQSLTKAMKLLRFTAAKPKRKPRKQP